MIKDVPKNSFSKIGVWKFCIFDKVTVGGVQERFFLALFKKGDHLDPNFGKRILGNIFDHKEDTLGIVLNPNSGP